MKRVRRYSEASVSRPRPSAVRATVVVRAKERRRARRRAATAAIGGKGRDCRGRDCHWSAGLEDGEFACSRYRPPSLVHRRRRIDALPRPSAEDDAGYGRLVVDGLAWHVQHPRDHRDVVGARVDAAAAKRPLAAAVGSTACCRSSRSWRKRRSCRPCRAGSGAGSRTGRRRPRARRREGRPAARGARRQPVRHRAAERRPAGAGQHAAERDGHGQVALVAAKPPWVIRATMPTQAAAAPQSSASGSRRVRTIVQAVKASASRMPDLVDRHEQRAGALEQLDGGVVAVARSTRWPPRSRGWRRAAAGRSPTTRGRARGTRWRCPARRRACGAGSRHSSHSP